MKDILEYLDNHSIAYDLFEHPAAFTVDEAIRYCSHIPGMHCKNLFLRDHKGRRHFLLIMPNDKKIELNSFSKSLNDRLSFASERRMKKYLSVSPGSVSPLGLIFDKNAEVIVLLDKQVEEAKLKSFHPNDNSKTLVFTKNEFQKFLASIPNEILQILI